MKKLLSFMFIALMPVAGFCLDSDVTRASMHKISKHSDTYVPENARYVYPDQTQYQYAADNSHEFSMYECGWGDIKVDNTLRLGAGHVFGGQVIDHEVRYLCTSGGWVDVSCTGLNGENVVFAANDKGNLTKEQCAEYSSTFTDENGLVYSALCRKNQVLVCKAKTCWDNSEADDAGKCPAKPTETKSAETKASSQNDNSANTNTKQLDKDAYMWNGTDRKSDDVKSPYAPDAQPQSKMDHPRWFDKAPQSKNDDDVLQAAASGQKSSGNTAQKSTTKRPTGNGAGYCNLQTRDFTGTSDYDMDEYLYRDSGTWEFYASSRARPVGPAVQVYECNGRSNAPDDACPEGATKILRAGAGIGNQTVASTGEYVFVCTNNSSIKSDSYKWLYTAIQERCLYTSSNVPTQENIDGQMLYYSSDYNVYCRNIEQVATKTEADQKMGPAGPAGRDGKDGKDGKDGRDGVDGKDGKDGRDGKDAAQISAGTDATGMHTIEATAKITTSRNDATSVQSRQSASQSRISILSGKLKEMQGGFKVTVWRNEDGTFNTTRLASDSIAAVVLGTTGGLVTSHVVKKNQVNKGFDDIQCTVGGQSVAGWGDEFRVGIQ